ncbi:hypothetical protein [Streptomyces ipomoeae]|uniref:Uncharacterized protein n=1 Tax=Streptomyces ipomoeae 91-03 TaxID=698759 RepID=L1L3S7_9ACTN|nr:hypothetical protein [Streptomyces ipomoeae]EKX67444.1 hypothetical protein STRIP9103_00299 [Streptomyces ipomoeae 91-03]MDX2697367.1 hypothetical protein [Streptomyces ipomoeae]MDX2842200.1 hypothetical protein [Streptomyces ipomoeae]
MTRTRTALLCATLLASALQVTAVTAAPRHEQHCTSTPGMLRGEARQIVDIVRKARREPGLEAALVRVATDGRELVTGSVGESMAGLATTTSRLHDHVTDPALFNPGTVGLPGATAICPVGVCEPMIEAFHYGIGVLAEKGWVFQNPSRSGFA